MTCKVISLQWTISKPRNNWAVKYMKTSLVQIELAHPYALMVIELA